MRRASLALFAALVGSLVVATAARANINNESLGRFGSGGGSEPAGPGKLRVTRSIATDPNTGHVYAIGSGGNNRIDEFTPWGEFVKAFGWDVAPGPVNEVQELRVRASGGTFKLTFGAATTADLPFDATATELKAALDGLSTIGGAGGSVGVTERKGATDGTVPYVYVIAFKGSLAGTDVAQIGAANGTTPPSGGVPTTTLEARTRADGTPGTTGLESCTAESGCKAGSEGGGGGQVASAFGAATDPSGNLYVRDAGNNRVQKFSPEGHFLWAIGGEVNKARSEEPTSTEAERNLCVVGEACQTGTSGTGDGQFEDGAGLAFAAGKLFVGDKGRIQVFDEAGKYLSELPVSGGNTARWIAVDPSRNRLYVDFGPGKDNVVVLDATTGVKSGELKEEYEERLNQPEALALDQAGNLFAATGVTFRRFEHVAEFGPTGQQLLPDGREESDCKVVEEAALEACNLFASPPSGAQLGGIGTGSSGDLYVANNFGGSNFIRAFGPPPLAFESPPPAPPSIEASYATAVSDTDASVRAEINPHFFSGALGTTRFYAQYATAACIEAEGWSGACVSEKPAPPGTALKSGPVDAVVKAAPVTLEGLTADTAYRFRFIAEGSGAPGVQIVGTGGTPSSEGKDASFRTFPSAAEEAAAQQACSENKAFRTGPSAALPDCRAYEMVSPIDKGGGEIKNPLEGLLATPAALVQSSPDGNKIVYGSLSSFGDAVSTPYASQYLASRTEGEQWRSRGISPPRTTGIQPAVQQLNTEIRYLSEDLCSTWLRTFSDPPLAPGAVAGYSNLYRHSLCSKTGGYETLTTAVPPGVEAAAYQPELQDIAAGGAEAIYAANGKLTANAPGPTKYVLYGFKQGFPEPRYLCILPGGTPSSEGCTAGGPLPAGLGNNREVRVENALSTDGTRVYWSTAAGGLYLRQNPFAEGAECSSEEAPCTTALKALAKEEKAQFWGASPDASTAIYSTSKGLFEFDAETKASVKLAGEVTGVAGMSEDAKDVYFVSREDLDGGGPSQAGDLNLYQREAAGPSILFVASLAARDVNPGAGKGFSSVAAVEPWLRGSKVSPDGQTIAFMSFAPLTGYDNHDLNSGEADSEAYLFRAGADGGAGALSCVSCNPSGSRPIGANISTESVAFWAAASLPVAENNLHEARVLTDEGKRLYFNSSDALVRADTNGVGDVYQWELAGTGSCQQGAPDYVASAEGCISLISSGHSQVASEFAEATPSGKDVFFTTLSSLVPQDPGVTDLYDARVEGGLPVPQGRAPSCEGEACQGPYTPPNDPTPASSTFHGAGNVREGMAKPSCKKPKVRRKGRCVKKAHHKKHKRRTERGRGGR